MAIAGKINLSLNDFERIGKRTPVLADLRPSGIINVQLIEIGGVVPLMKVCFEKGLIDGNQMTVTGKTLEENLTDYDHTKRSKNNYINR